MPTPTRRDDDVTLDILDLYLQDMSMARIASSVGLTPNTVRRRISRVIVEDCGHDPDAPPYWRNI